MKRANVEKLVNERIADLDFRVQALGERFKQIEDRFAALVRILSREPAIESTLTSCEAIPF